ncbi:MAG: HD domain-containing protein [Actinomycetia bacterium]|nr:HD domain-containing protein [Actinomycetes bacterium]
MNINPLLLKIYEAANMRRWNDQIRTIEFTELDKQAHKMIVAYILGKCEQDHSGHEIDWIKIIETGFFDFLKRIILTDLKPPLIYKIKEDKRKYRKLNQWVFERINPYVEVLGKDFVERLREHLYSGKEDLETKIVNVAHFYITEWEFHILSQSSPPNFLFEEIDQSIKREQEEYHGLDSREFFHNNEKLNNFVDIACQLRFQQRWSHLYRIPRTSVLGHMLIVAIFSYLFSYKTGSSREKRINNYFTGLFHDFPEVLTRDIINPVKKSVEVLDDLIKEYEIQEMEKKIYKLIPEGWHEDMRQYTEDEFSDTDSRDGSLVKGADDLAAYIEAYLTLKNGIKNQSLTSAMESLRDKYRNREIMGIDFEEIYAGFERGREAR